MFVDTRCGSSGVFGFMLGRLWEGTVSLCKKTLQRFQKVLQVGTTEKSFLEWKFLLCDPAAASVQRGKPVCVSAESQPQLSREGRCSGRAPAAAQQNSNGLAHSGLGLKKRLSPGFAFGFEVGSCCQVSALIRYGC